MTDDTPPDEDIFKILVATDNHLGYGEKNPEIADDSFRTFEEILQLAVEHSVDFILLGGDLFHNACPSAFATYKCLDLLRKYCLGDKPVEFEFLSDQSFHFSHLSNPTVNYEDPNLNVSIPVFSIHGNHDDPIGLKQLSALDILASAGLINYFGHWNDLTKVDVAPVLLKKGETELAIYGMSHIKDERLGRLFLDKKVTFFKSEGDWFNLLVLHQNRYEGRGRKNFVPDVVLPEFLNLVIWGHEHECIIEPMKSRNDTYISQPGSSVATSLSKGECVQKHVGLLQIYKKRFKMTPIPLKTVRPFVYNEIVLYIRDEDNEDEYVNKTAKEYAIQQVNEAMEKLIIEATKKVTEENKNMLPFVRLVAQYVDDCQTFNGIRLGLTFKDRIINPEDAILVKRAKPRNCKNKNNYEVLEDDDLKKPSDWADCVEDVVRKYFQNEENAKKIKVCYIEHLLEAVKRFTDKEESESSSSSFDPFNVVLDHEQQETVKHVKKIAPEPGDLSDCLENLRVAKQADNNKPVITDVVKLLDDMKQSLPKRSKKSVSSDDDEEAVMISDDDDGTSSVVNVNNRSARGRGSRGGKRGAETGRAKRRGKGRVSAAT